MIHRPYCWVQLRCAVIRRGPISFGDQDLNSCAPDVICGAAGNTRQQGHIWIIGLLGSILRSHCTMSLLCKDLLLPLSQRILATAYIRLHGCRSRQSVVRHELRPAVMLSYNPVQGGHPAPVVTHVSNECTAATMHLTQKTLQQQRTLSLSIHLCMVSHAKGQAPNPRWAVASPALPARARSAIRLAANLQRISSTLAPAQHHQAGSGEHTVAGSVASLAS